MPKTKISRIEPKRVAFRGVGNKITREILSETVTTYSPIRQSYAPVIAYVSYDLADRLRIPRRKFVNMVFGDLLFQAQIPKNSILRHFYNLDSSWHLQRRDMRIWATVYIVYEGALERFLEGDDPFPVMSPVNFVFSYRTTYLTVRKEATLRFFFNLMAKYIKVKYSPDATPVAFYIGKLDIGHQSKASRFTQKEINRLVELGVFDSIPKKRETIRQLERMI